MIKEITLDRVYVVEDGENIGYLSLWIRMHFGIEEGEAFSVEITEGENYVFVPYLGSEGRLLSLCKVEGTKNTVIGNICREKTESFFPEIKIDTKYNIVVKKK